MNTENEVPKIADVEINDENVLDDGENQVPKIISK